MDIMNKILDESKLSDAEALPFLGDVIGDLELFGRKIYRPYEEDPRPKLLRFLLTSGHVTEEQLRMATHRKLLEIGQKEGMSLIRTGEYADHCLSPEALGYAMLHSDGGTEKWDGIRYDHGDSQDTVRHSGNGLLEIVLRQLLTESVRPKIRPLYFPYPEWLS